MNPDVKGLRDYLTILNRRKWQFTVPAAMLFVVCVLTAFLWPPTYQSSALILIEEPDVPRDLVRSTISSFASERIQVISQRVLVTSNLIKIMDKYNLYAKRRKRVPVGVVVEEMREDMSLELINADVIDPRSGRPTQATIAFSVNFDHRSPATAQKILNELVSLYLGENLRSRREKAAETTGFIAGEAAKYRDLVSELEAKLAEFKKRHSGTLPEDAKVNLQLMARTDGALLNVRRELQALDERKIYIAAQLTLLSPYAPMRVDGDLVLDPAAQLKALQAKFVSLSGVYGPEHPDVRRLAREIDALEEEVGGTGDTEELERRREKLLAELAAARKRYSNEHPDVKRLERQLESLLAVLGKSRSQTSNPASPKGPDNPAYVQLATQLEAIGSEVRALRGQHSALQQRLKTFEKRVSEAPQVEREYLVLRRDYENAVDIYREVKSKLTVAEIGESLEEERKSERFSLIEPPTSPTEPIKPNRLAILFIGLVFSLAAGAGTTALFESLDQSVYGPKQLADITGVPPLVVIPYIKNRADVRRARTRRILVPFGSVLCVYLFLIAVNEYFLPLDVLWAMAERRMELFLLEIGIV